MLIAAVSLIYGFAPASWPVMVLANPAAILSSPWLKLGAVLIGAAIFGGMAYWEARRNRRPVVKAQALPEVQAPAEKRTAKQAVPAAPGVGAWKAAHEALEVYADPDLIKARDYWSLKFSTASEKEAEVKQQVKDIRDKFPNGVVPKEADAWPDLEQLERQQRAKELVTMHSEEEIRRVWIEIRTDINKKLCTGTLVAKGLREPRVAGSSEVQISPAEWRILILRHLEARAVERGIDGKVIYSGIVIRKALN
jgi:hypothetical protein